jgi:hypothetical protein
VRLRALALACVLALPPAVPAQTSAVADPEVKKGIAQVDDGEYDAAILTLDAASRRLAAARGANTTDLAEAYFYLGVAYLGKGHETSARARFREAVKQARDMSPSPEKFPPRVIELFEKAREESKAEAPASPAPVAAAAPAAAPAPEKKGSGSRTLLIVGGVALVGGGAAVALGGGGDDDPGPEDIPEGTTLTRTESGTLGAQQQAGFTFVATRPGMMEATVTWQDRNIALQIDCQEEAPPYTGCGGVFARTSDTSGRYTASVTQKTYLVLVSNFSSRAGAEPFTITIRYP